MTKTLIIRTDDRRIVADLHWRNGKLTVRFASKRMRPDVERWVVDGLHEWVGHGVEAEPRTTPSSDPLFLERVDAYVRRQFDFQTQFDDDGVIGFHRAEMLSELGHTYSVFRFRLNIQATPEAANVADDVRWRSSGEIHVIEIKSHTLDPLISIANANFVVDPDKRPAALKPATVEQPFPPSDQLRLNIQ